MIKHYFRIAWRTLVKSKGYSAINIGGLSLGMVVTMLIGLWVWDEFSYNKNFENHDHIGVVMYTETRDGETYSNNTTPIPMGMELRSTYKTNFKYVVMSTQPGDHILSAGEKKFTQTGSYMQPEGPELFTLKMIYGKRNGLSDPYSILLAKSVAGKFFGTTNPIGKVVRMDNNTDVKVSGVYEDFPQNSELSNVSFIAPWDLFTTNNKWINDVKEPWRNNFLRIYVQIDPSTDFASVSASIKDVKLRNVNASLAARKPVVFVHPMSEWHLHSTFENGVQVTSEQMKFIWLYSIIGVFVLFLACINFMNLSTARSEKRAKEVGVRKAVGSARGQLIKQFFSESLLVAVVAFVLSLCLLKIILPWFNEVADKGITLPWNSLWFWVAGLAFTFVTGLLAGSYPALYLSSFNPIKVLKGRFRAGRFAAIPRKVLVVVQFTVSVTLIIGTVIVYRQVQMAKDRSVGYSREGLLVFGKTTSDFDGKGDVLRSELIKTGAVTEVAESGGDVTTIWSSNGGFEWKGKDPGLVAYFGTMAVSPGFGKVIGWQMAAGRDFSKDIPTDSSAIILNESAVKLMGIKDPVGETIRWENDWYKGGNLKVIGVVKDMLMASPFEAARPSVFFLRGYTGRILVRMNPNISTGVALSKIEPVFRKLFPSAPFEYKFVDEEYGKKFKAEERVGKLALFFAILAILISCLGLFGLAAFVAEQRVKEIGIRKVLGASAINLWGLLSREFVLLVMISLVIAGPIAYYFMNTWLQKYEFRAGIPWWIFAAAALGGLTITLLTVSFQAIKAIITNPARSLRTE